MNILQNIKNLFYKKTEQTQNQEEDSMKCPTCGYSKWIEGPSGGGSVNVTCGECHSKYNYMGPFGLQEFRKLLFYPE